MAIRYKALENAAARAFPKAQALLAGPPLRQLGTIEVGWHDTLVHAKAGAFAVVGDGAGLDELLGEVVRVEYGAREIYVLVFAARAVPVPLSLARRAFVALALPALESIDCTVDVIE